MLRRRFDSPLIADQVFWTAQGDMRLDEFLPLPLHSHKQGLLALLVLLGACVVTDAITVVEIIIFPLFLLLFLLLLNSNILPIFRPTHPLDLRTVWVL